MLNGLIIDDKKIVLESLEDYFTQRQFHITTARSAEQGLARLNEAFDFICVDFDMPGMNGHDFCFTLKNHPEFSQFDNIPVIGIGDFPRDKREYLHFNACFPKPIEFGELLYTINRIHFGEEL